MMRAGNTRRGPLAIRVSGGWSPPAGSIFAADFVADRYWWNGALRPLTDFTFTRSTTGTFVGSNGLVQTAAINGLRIEHTAAGQRRGVLMERSSTNAIINSVSPGGTGWDSQNSAGASVTVDSTTITSPDGTGNAVQLTCTRPNTTTFAFRRNTTAASFSGVYRHSLWIRAASVGEVGKQITIWAFEGSTRNATNFTLTAGWQRVATNNNHSSTGTITEPFNVGLLQAASGGATTLSVSFQIWGPQLENGNLITSYIPTTAATVTRGDDNLQLTGMAARGITFANPVTVGNTVYIEYEKFQTDASFPAVYELRDAIVGSRWRTYHLGNNDVRTGVVAGFTGQGEVLIGSGVSSPAINKLGYRVRQGDTRGYINGSSATGFAPGLVETVDIALIGCGDQPINGIVRRMTVYNSAFDNTQLASLTA